jgi:outer membrane protein TolC
MDVNASYSQYMLALQKIELTKKAVLQATENQRVLKDQFDNNIKVLTDLLDADLLLLQAKLNEANAKIDAETAWYKLVKSTGQ